MIGLMDILPDAIGFALIFIGISKLSMISAELNDTVAYIKWAAVISLARVVCLIASGGFDETMVLCLSMVLAVLEFGVMFLALPVFTDGLEYLNIRYSGKFGEMNDLRLVGTVFFAARGFLSVLPQLGALSIGAEDEGDVIGESTAVDWSAYSNMLQLVNIVLTLIVACFFAVLLVKYLWGMYKDSEFVRALNDEYCNVKRTDPGRFIRRRLIYAFNMLMLAAFFIIDIIGDGKNYVPDVAFALLSLVAVWLLSAYCDGAKRAYITGGIYAGVSLISWIYSFIFAKKRYFMAFDILITMFPEEYILTVAFSVAEAIALILYARELIPLLRQVAERYVGIEVSAEFVRTVERNKGIAKGLKLRVDALFIAFCVVAASGVVFSATLHSMPIYWMVHMVLNIALFIFVVNISSKYISEINMRYERPGE